MVPHDAGSSFRLEEKQNIRDSRRERSLPHGTGSAPPEASAEAGHWRPAGKAHPQLSKWRKRSMCLLIRRGGRLHTMISDVLLLFSDTPTVLSGKHMAMPSPDSQPRGSPAGKRGCWQLLSSYCVPIAWLGMLPATTALGRRFCSHYTNVKTETKEVKKLMGQQEYLDLNKSPPAAGI